MKLKEFIKKNKGLRVKIGTDLGSSFFYCDMITDDIEHEIVLISNKFKKFYKDSAEAKTILAENCPVAYKKKIIEKQVQKYLKLYKEFTSLLERRVVEVFDSVSYDELDAKIVMIKGNEHGRYWTIKEYTKDSNKEKERLRKQEEEIKQQMLEEKAKRIAEIKMKQQFEKQKGVICKWHTKDY